MIVSNLEGLLKGLYRPFSRQADSVYAAIFQNARGPSKYVDSRAANFSHLHLTRLYRPLKKGTIYLSLYIVWLKGIYSLGFDCVFTI